MPKFVDGQVYKLTTETDYIFNPKHGYLWIYSYYNEPQDLYYFKSIATGSIDWWPEHWMIGLD
jgi:hypothetical protein